MSSCVKPGFTLWRDLVINLVFKEIRVRYMGATLGFLWSLGNPLAVTLTYYLVFTYILPSAQERFALHLITGLVHWMLLTQMLSQSGEWLTGNANLIRKLRFPRILLPVTGALTILVFWLGVMLIYAALFPLLGGVPSLALLVYPLILASFMALLMGLGLALSVIQITVRDARHLVEVFVPLLFWMTPIVWVASSLPTAVAKWMAFNPLAPYFKSFKAILHEGVMPSAGDIGLCVMLGVTSLLAGLLVFRKADSQVEYL
ncbi:ABC transporter permease [uncultured Pseudomonas sp.]|uniref:ABC transporter permease n=1 Tax=uncultured Pseudomonas sp. TaxID=114707 RepID=UPI0025E0E2B5|nr:ABC transporter permease [uncultured Pseudomonas sp.]